MVLLSCEGIGSKGESIRTRGLQVDMFIILLPPSTFPSRERLRKRLQGFTINPESKPGAFSLSLNKKHTFDLKSSKTEGQHRFPMDLADFLDASTS